MESENHTLAVFISTEGRFTHQARILIKTDMLKRRKENHRLAMFINIEGRYHPSGEDTKKDRNAGNTAAVSQLRSALRMVRG